MANEIYANYESGNTLYAIIRNKAGEVWYANGQVFESWGTDGRDAADYSINLIDKGGSLYMCDFDESVPPGKYYIQIFLQAGAEPDNGDNLANKGEIIWSGTGQISSEKILVNKAVQNKSTGQIQYFDDDGQTVLVTLSPSEDHDYVTRTFS
jgi:hypothetical protein